MEHNPEQSTEYESFDFRGFIKDIYLEFNNIALDQELEEDQKNRSYEYIICSANDFLNDMDIVDTPAIIHDGAYILPHETDGSDEYIKLNGTILGNYIGLDFKEIEIGDTGLNYFRISHLIEIDHIETDSAYEYDDIDTVIVPLDSNKIDLLLAPLSSPANEQELSDLCYELYCKPENGLQTYHLNEMFNNVYKNSANPDTRQKNLDWLLDQLEHYAGLKGDYVNIHTYFYYELTDESGEIATILPKEEQVSGYVIGFGDINDYIIAPNQAGIMFPYSKPSKTLAIYIETYDETEDSDRILKIPIKSCGEITLWSTIEQN